VSRAGCLPLGSPLGLTLGLALALAAPLSARAGAWTAPSSVTSIELDAETLRALGFEIAVHNGTASSRFRGATFRSVPPSLLELRAPGGDFERFDAGELVHDGGFVLSGPAGRLPLDPLVLRVSEGSGDDFDWLDAAGRRWFVLRDMHFAASFESQELRVEGLSIHVAPELARFLGVEALAGTYVGVANLLLPALIAAEDGGGAGGGFCPETEGTVDIELIGIDAVSQLAREPGVRVALAPSAELANVGTASVEWYRAILPIPSGAVGPHPYLSLSMFRLDPDGSIVQLGLGDVKHAYFAVNEGCACAGGHILYPGCTDVYGVATNADRENLAPRDEVHAFTGSWERVGSHFDRCFLATCNPATDDADDFRDHGGNAPVGLHHDSFEHLVVVPEAELAVAGARYFADAWYVVGGDVDLFNSMGHREVAPALSSVWTFGLLGPLANGSVLEEIPGADLATLDTGEGRLQLAATTADLGGGSHHYEYALMNFDFDRQIDRFEVPIDASIAVQSLDSRGLGDEPGNDWTASVGPDSVSWQAPPGTGLDWGMLVSFGFDADAAPVASEVSVAVREAGSPARFAFAVAAPAPEPGVRTLGAGAILGLVAVSSRRRSA
jgi:hypothetical protein